MLLNARGTPHNLFYIALLEKQIIHFLWLICRQTNSWPCDRYHVRSIILGNVKCIPIIQNCSIEYRENTYQMYDPHSDFCSKLYQLRHFLSAFHRHVFYSTDDHGRVYGGRSVGKRRKKRKRRTVKVRRGMPRVGTRHGNCKGTGRSLAMICCRVGCPMTPPAGA